MNSMRWLPVLALVTVASGCGGGGGSDNGSTTPAPVDGPYKELKEKAKVMEQNALVNLQGIDCNNDSQLPACQKVTVSFNQGQFSADKVDADQTVLFIDSGMGYQLNLTGRSRVEALFKLNKDEIISFNMETQVPLYLKQTVEKFDQHSEFIHSGWLETLGTRIADIGGYSGAGHGEHSFRKVLAHNPRASFVFLETPDILMENSDSFCKLDFTAVNDKAKRIAQQIKTKIIDEYDIEYVTWSGGFSTSTIRATWAQSCPNQAAPSLAQLQELENSLRPYYNVLFNSEGVLGIQSAGEYVQPETHVLDADDSFNNRLRVGYYQTLDSQLPIDGIIGDKQPPTIPDFMNGSRKYIDVFINFGFTGRVSQGTLETNASPMMTTRYSGMGYFAESNTHTSWVPPTVLAWAIKVKNSKYPDQIMTNDVIEQIKDQMTPMGCTFHKEDEGRCKVQDPAWYKQHELARLNYLK